MRLRHPIDVLLLVGAVLALLTAAWLTHTGQWRFQEDARYICYFVVAWLAARLSVSSRSRGENCSMSFVFVLVALVELSTVETLVIASCAILLNGLSEKVLGQPLPATAENMVANLVSTAVAAMASQWAYRAVPADAWLEWPVRFVGASIVCFVAGNLPLLAIAVWKGDAWWRRLMHSLYVFSFPYYIVAATLTALYAAVAPFVHWYATAALIPMMIGIHYSMSRYSAEIDRYRAQADDVGAVHLRTMEALAAAMEKDDGMQEHLRRMRVYCLGLGKTLGMSRPELDALEAAAVLHDVGKLAVPDHIISKNGSYTAEELEKMRTHAAIGEGIIERARFPYPVAAMGRSHHEHWDGSGYPDGLVGEKIPLGARILAIVDALDALVTERSHHRRVGLDEAVERIASHAGKEYDPRVVKALKRKFPVFEEALAAAQATREPRPARYLESLGAARNEISALFKLHDQLLSAMSVPEIAHALRTGFRDLVPYDALALYMNGAPDAKPDVVCGDRSAIRRARAHLTLDLPLAEGSAGRLELYNLLAGRLTAAHLRTAQSVLPRVAQAVENVRRYQSTSASASTDFLTQLPNAQSLFERLALEIENARQSRTGVTVLICDLDGFKNVNDTLGHLTGNRVLQAVSQAFRERTREIDYVARLGGDEFVIILPGMAAERLPERIADLRRVAREAGRLACGAMVIDASFGAARFPEDAADSDDLVAAADQRMYDEKRKRKKTRPGDTAYDRGPINEEQVV